MSLSPSLLLKRLEALETELYAAEVEVMSSSTSPITREVTKSRRLFFPGQMLRFPTENAWSDFLNQYSLEDDAYDRVEHTDPLGFSGTTPVYYPNGGDNPLNYLRRNQLPSMRIDMTNIYNPTIRGETTGDEAVEYCIPFMGQKNGQYWPEIIYPKGAYTTNIIPPEKGYVRRTLPVAVPPTRMPLVMNCKDAIEDARHVVNWSGNWYFSFWIHMRNEQVLPAMDPVKVALVFPYQASIPIPQFVDCSKPTVGCFWFNDGKNGQIELPKDPACRTCVIIRFKKYVLL